MSIPPEYHATPDIHDPATWGSHLSLDVQAAEKMSLAGNTLAAIFYGITIVLFCQCMGYLWNNGFTIRRPLLYYVAVSFVLSTLSTAFNLNVLTMGFVENRNFPGSPGVYPPGPVGYIYHSHNNWRVITANACFIICDCMADGLQMLRCYMLYDKRISVLIIPVLLYCASFAMGLVTIYNTSYSSIYSEMSFSFAFPYFLISVALNILLTLLMVARIVSRLNVMNKGEELPIISARCGNMITILVESCALYSINCIVFLVAYGIRHNAATIFLPLLSQTQVIAPYLIISRVATNRSITHSITATGIFTSPPPTFTKTDSSIIMSDSLRIPSPYGETSQESSC